MGYGQNSNSSNLLWLSLLPARMKKFYSQMKVPESSQHFSCYKSMENFQAQQLCSPWTDLDKFQTHIRFYDCPRCLQNGRLGNRK